MPNKRSKKAGLPPGSLVFLGDQRVEHPTISVIAYNTAGIQETEVRAPSDCPSFITPENVTWINITGLHDTTLIKQAGETFLIHPLILEDLLNTGQRPKFEDHGNLLFCVLKMLYRPAANKEQVVSEQISLLLGKGFVITFQEVNGDVFDTIRNRIRTGGGRIRGQGSDYLAYALIDAIVDNYFAVLEYFDDSIENLQQRALDAPVPDTLREIHALKHEVTGIRRQLWPLREAVSALLKCENTLFSKSLTPYLHDVYEHTFQVLETLESMREMIASALETYMSSVSNRMNEIMKVLTIMSTLFIPLTFIAGIYGMNFDHMPELHMPLGYRMTLLAMALVAAGMLLFFRRRKWI